MRIYVASSWRNNYQPDVVRALREVGHEVYDFRKPGPGCFGFSWSDIDQNWKLWTVEEFVNGLKHPTAVIGFSRDFEAMLLADACVLVLPCGRSAHIEAGWFVGAGKPLLVLADQGEPELMYAMADSIHAALGELLLRLQQIEVEKGAEER